MTDPYEIALFFIVIFIIVLIIEENQKIKRK